MFGAPSLPPTTNMTLNMLFKLILFLRTLKLKTLTPYLQNYYTHYIRRIRSVQVILGTQSSVSQTLPFITGNISTVHIQCALCTVQDISQNHLIQSLLKSCVTGSVIPMLWITDVDTDIHRALCLYQYDSNINSKTPKCSFGLPNMSHFHSIILLKFKTKYICLLFVYW